VGGYGAVGRAVALTLAQHLDARVVVAGRDERRARELARLAPEALIPRRFDVDRADDVERLPEQAAVVVMCVERGNEAVARACLERGVHVVDVGASVPTLTAIERLGDVAERGGAAAVLSVGLAPGLTNLLARRCVDRLPSATSIDVTVLLGLSGDHGPDSVRWTLENLAAPVPRTAGGPRRARVLLPGSGVRTAYPFPFSDQHILARALGIPVTTRVCFDSAAVTAALFGLRRAGIVRGLHRAGAGRLLTAAATRLPVGSDRFVVHAAAVDGSGAGTWSAVTGRRECRATGVVAAHVADLLLRRPPPPGVHHIDDVLAAEEFLPRLRPFGLAFQEGAPGVQGRPASRRRRSFTSTAP
jgi:NAD(P)-dependent dehydrogenase (short-subunit alcohol dehydrogenase family)